jgi:hypothetical protein
MQLRRYWIKDFIYLSESSLSNFLNNLIVLIKNVDWKLTFMAIIIAWFVHIVYSKFLIIELIKLNIKIMVKLYQNNYQFTSKYVSIYLIKFTNLLKHKIIHLTLFLNLK